MKQTIARENADWKKFLAKCKLTGIKPPTLAVRIHEARIIELSK